MSGYLDGDTLAQCHQALRDGKTLDELAGKLHYAPEALGRRLQLPAVKPAEPAADEFDLWSVDRLDGVL